MEWTRKVLTEFIEMYKERPCLWKIKDMSYVNKNLKRIAYEELVCFLKENNFTKITVGEVKMKIQNMRNAFRKESKKIEECNKNATGVDQIYTPSLWYYELLLFTKDQDAPLHSSDNVSTTETIEIIQNVKEEQEEEEEMEEIRNDNDDSVHTEEPEDLSYTESNKTEFKQPLVRSNKKKRKDSEELTTFIRACTKTLSTPDTQDEFDAICVSFAAKMRKMESRQQIFAESLMHKIITQGLLNKLNEYMDIVDVGESIPQYVQPWQQAQRLPILSPEQEMSSSAASSSPTTFTTTTLADFHT